MLVLRAVRGVNAAAFAAACLLACGGTTGWERVDAQRPPLDVGAADASIVDPVADAQPFDATRPAPRDAASAPLDATHESAAADAAATCGNGTVDDGEGCDDGNTNDGDGCASFCQDSSHCDACLAAKCANPTDAIFPPCASNVEGTASDGPAAGVARATLCRELYACVTRTACGPSNLSDCYCGASSGAACLTPHAATGACKAEVEAALETTDPATIATRFGDTAFEGGVALQLVQCGRDACSQECAPRVGFRR